MTAEADAASAQRAAGAGPATARWMRAAFLGPRGGGTTRRRASDAFRLGIAATGDAARFALRVRCSQRGRCREAGLIAGLTSAGVPQDQAVAAVLIQRLCTAYLPPIWGWLTLAWMRRREYV